MHSEYNKLRERNLTRGSSPPWEGNRCSASQETVSVLWNRMFITCPLIL